MRYRQAQYHLSSYLACGSMMKSMDIAVTGAYGHLGVNLIRRLAADGHSIRAIDVRSSSALSDLDLDHVTADVTDRDSMKEALVGAEVVYHLAGVISVTGDPDGSVWRTNVDGAAATGRAALTTKVRRYVHVSSVHALDLATASSPITEGAEPTLRSTAPVYDRSKATAERFVEDLIEAGLDAVIVRPTGIIGPDDHRPSRMGSFFQALIAGRMTSVVGGAFDWVDTRDVADAMVAAADRGKRGSGYIIGGTFASVGDLARLVAETAGVRAPRFTVPLGIAELIGRPATWWASRTGNPLAPTSEALNALRNGKPVDISLARAELGYSPRPLSETVRDIVVWFDDNEPDSVR